MVMRGTALSLVVLLRILVCPHCKRLRECRCLATSPDGTLWACGYCGRELHLGKQLSISLLSEGEVSYG